MLANGRSMTATAVAQATGGNLATTHRFLLTLEEMGAVFRSARGHFMLGNTLAVLGAKVEGPRLLAAAVQPHLDALAAEFGEVAHCGTLRGRAAADLARALPDRPMVGHAADTASPLHCTALGKMLLASLRDSYQDHLLGQIPLQRHTSRTLVTTEALKQELLRIRAAGYAVDDEEWEAGLRSVAVPVQDAQHRTIAALALSAPRSRLPDKRLALVRAALLRHAEQIGRTFTESHVFPQQARPRGSFPHLKRVGDFIFLSGTSARRPDESFEGATIQEQTRALFANIRTMLEAVGASLADLVEVQAYLIDAADYAGFNQAYAEFFDTTGPTRTTVVVRDLPHPLQLLMVRATAFRPQTVDTAI